MSMQAVFEPDVVEASAELAIQAIVESRGAVDLFRARVLPDLYRAEALRYR